MYVAIEQRSELPVELQRAAEIHLNEDLLAQARSRGVGLTELLEELDPSEGGSALDAFERQLALAGIRVQGPEATTVDRFFASTESSVLFPEFVSRSVRTGMADFRGLDQILAARTRISSDVYRTLYMDEAVNTRPDFHLARTGEGSELPRMEIKTAEHAVRIHKFGRYLEVTYEALRRKTTSVVGVFLKAVGYQIQKDKFEEALAVLLNGDGNNNPAPAHQTSSAGTLSYGDLVEFELSFRPYDLNVIIASPSVCKTILTLEEFKDSSAGFRYQDSGDLVTPFGAVLIPSEVVSDDHLLGLDKRFALEEVYETALVVESDRLIRRQLEGTAISEVAGFARVITPACRVLEIDWS